jgi:hypothetical protein
MNEAEAGFTGDPGLTEGVTDEEGDRVAGLHAASTKAQVSPTIAERRRRKLMTPTRRRPPGSRYSDPWLGL